MSFYAALLGTDHGNNPTFQKNFFADFKEALKRTPAAGVIKNFEDCDFTPVYDYLNQLKEQKKQMTKDEKKAIKDEKAAIDQIYGYCLMDGRREKVGNFRIEPPGLFRGRGEHPKTGCLKVNVQSDVATSSSRTSDDQYWKKCKGS
jgi:DNA topoisomerase I